MSIVTHEDQKRVLDHLDPEFQMIENGSKWVWGTKLRFSPKAVLLSQFHATT